MEAERSERPEATEALRTELEARGLSRGSLVLLDSAPLVYLVEGGAERRAAMTAFLGAAESLELRLAVSALAWTELLRGPLSRRDEAGAARYRRLLAETRGLMVAAVDVAIAEAAAFLLADALPPPLHGARQTGDRRSWGAAGKPLGLPDAIHLATALVLEAEAFLTNDEALARRAAALPRGPRILLLDELAFGLPSG